MSFELTSAAFEAGERIPSDYTCDGEDVSPPFEWIGAPQNTKSLILVTDDPDAPGGTWDHSMIYNLPSDTNSLMPGIPGDAELSDGSRHGLNSWRRLGYGGPCPSSGTHRYFFKLCAPGTVLGLPAGATKLRVNRVVAGHILGQTKLMGLYSRQ